MGGNIYFLPMSEAAKGLARRLCSVVLSAKELDAEAERINTDVVVYGICQKAQEVLSEHMHAAGGR